jgi:hypothetical protein
MKKTSKEKIKNEIKKKDVGIKTSVEKRIIIAKPF